MPSECGRMSARGITLSVIRLATSHDAADVARLMIGFRDWWSRTEPPDAAFEAGVRRLLADPNTDFLLAGDPPAGVCQLRYRYAIWTESDDCWLEDIFVEEEARGSGMGRELWRPPSTAPASAAARAWSWT